MNNNSTNLGTIIAKIVTDRGGRVGIGQLWEVYNGMLIKWHTSLGPRPTLAEIQAVEIPEVSGISKGEKWVIDQGFDADRKVILLNKLLKVKEEGPTSIAAHPKLVALYAWMETVQGMAVAGQTDFPPAPHTFEEVLAE